MPHRLRSVIYGAAAGAALAVTALAVFGSRASLRSIEGVLLDPMTGRGRGDFVVTAGGLYMVVIIIAMLAALLVAGLVYSFGRETDPEGSRFPLRYLLPTAAITAAIVTYASLRASLGAMADIEAGVVTVSVFRMIIAVLVAGALGGALTASVVDALARPSFLGFEGEAVPTSTGAFVKEMMTAIGAPTIAMVSIAVLAIALSQVLLSLHGAGSVIVFSVVGAVVLGVGALIAYRPWDRSNA